MALSVTEAHAVNTLLRWLLPADKDPGRGPVNSIEAEDAAALLAEHANRTLSAGLTAVRVRAAWPGVRHPAKGGSPK